MKTFLQCVLLTLLFAPNLAWAQANPLPVPPYTREHVEAIQGLIEAVEDQIGTTRTDLAARQTAAAVEGLEPPEKERLDKEVSSAQVLLDSLLTRVAELRLALKQAQEGPTQIELERRIAYDRAYALAVQVREELTPGGPAGDDTVSPEGEIAKGLRQAEDEQKRIELLADGAQEFDFQKSRVFEKLSDLEKVEYESRWAAERLQLSIDAYNHLSGPLFKAYRDYETRAFEGLAAADRALALWRQVSGTPAERAEGTPAPLDPKELPFIRQGIQDLYAARTGRVPGNRKLWMRAHEGSLQEIQREIDIREDYMERLDQDAERLKVILSSSSEGSGAKTDEAALILAPDGQEEYQRLGRKIDTLKQTVTDNELDIRRLGEERVELERIVATKKQQEVEAKEITAATQAEIDAIERELATPGADPRFYARPAALIFTLRERLKAEEERHSAAIRDTRRIQTQVDILDRRIQGLKELSADIQATQLAAARSVYYEEIGRTIAIRAGKIALVVLLAWLLLFMIRKLGEPLIERIVRRADRRHNHNADSQQRARTLMTVFMTTAKVVVWVTAIMFVVTQFDVDYGPLLVAAGGVSLAVGFGAQSLVKDFFSGFFILLEGQFSIGDVVEINGKTGTVENVNLRTTVIRGLNGDVHTIPNGEISMTSNQTKVWSRAVLDIGVAYEENTDEVTQVLEAVGKEMQAIEPWDKKLLDVILMGVERMDDSAVVLRVLLKTRAGEQWGAAREYRRRVKLKFDEYGIEIPWPQQVESRKWYEGMEPNAVEQQRRKKRAQMLRYVRKMRGEEVEEDPALAAMSVEERDRAETIAKREVEIATQKSEEDKPGQKAETPVEPVQDDEQVSAAEKLGKQLAAQEVKKVEATRRIEKQGGPGGKVPEDDEQPKRDKPE